MARHEVRIGELVRRIKREACRCTGGKLGRGQMEARLRCSASHGTFHPICSLESQADDPIPPVIHVRRARQARKASMAYLLAIQVLLRSTVYCVLLDSRKSAVMQRTAEQISNEVILVARI